MILQGTIEDLRKQVEANTEVNESARLLINGFAARLQAAKDAAVTNGATEAEVAPIVAEIATLKKSTAALAEAVAANTEA